MSDSGPVASALRATPATAARADLVIVGTGFASCFFLGEYLRSAPAKVRVVVLEKGARRSHAWQLEGGLGRLRDESSAQFLSRKSTKPWWVSLALGGGSNCWWACTPRLLPNDFRMQSVYGVGRDWPVSYHELENCYARAEAILSVAGPSDDSPFERSTPYPQPPHRLNQPDQLLKRAYPEHFFAMPTARPSRGSAGGRPRCCANGVCGLCPIDSKFTVLNEMAALFEDPRVELRTGASVQAVDVAGGVAQGVHYQFRDDAGGELREESVRADLVVLGANAIFNPHILLRSGLEHPVLGRRLFEQAAVRAVVDLDGVDGFQGSTSLTGHGYMLYDGPHRAERAAVLIETSNVPELRAERGKWRQVMRIKCILDDLPDESNRVEVAADDPTRPEVIFGERSDYAVRTLLRLQRDLELLLADLPVESIQVRRQYDRTEGHVLGTCVMGDDPASSIVDRHLVHHQVRNLLVLGGSAFPVSSPSNPTLTIAALALWAADAVLG